MRARPGRLLPSVMVGGLLISGLALGAGTASAAPVLCEYKSAEYDISSLPAVLKVVDGACTPVLDLGVLDDLMADLKPYVAPKQATTTTPTTPLPTTTTPSPATTPTSVGNGPSKSGGGAGNLGVLPPAAGPAVGGAPVGLAAAAGPVGALPPLAGVAPAGLAAGLFTANNYDPGLLFGSPLGDAASALFSPKADSAVTTVSQAQALAAPDGTGYGTPATIGVIILACLIGFAVRHRVITRMKARELPAAEYQPRHAAPELETEPETELQPAADEARTLVVLTRR